MIAETLIELDIDKSDHELTAGELRVYLNDEILFFK